MRKLLLLLVVSVGLTACFGGWGSKTSSSNGVWDDRYHNKRLKENAFMMEVIRFKDVRRPRDRVPDNSQNIIYEYNPDELLSGIKYRLPVLLEKHFGVTNPSELVYTVEIELKKLRTATKTGSLKHGSFGKYDVELEVDVMVRRPNSSIIYKDNLDIKLDQRRRSSKGRSPSAKLDKQRMFDLTETAIRKVAQKVGWRVRTIHAQEVRDRELEEIEAQESIYDDKE